MKRYLINFLIGLDQWGNTLLGGAPDETISSRAGRLRGDDSKPVRQWMSRQLCRILDWLDPGHCADAVTAERDGHRDGVIH